MADKSSPNSKLFTNCLKAFIIGGGICLLGQLFTNWFVSMGVEKETAGTLNSVLLILITAFLTGIGVFDEICKFGGAGAVVPISGFANSVAAPAIEYKKEGFIFGVGAKMFVIAGPVIVYGIATSVLVGVIYYIFK